MANLKIYTDESGQTGPDLFSAEQPFYVLAAVLLTEEQLRLTQVRIGQDQPVELKFALLQRTPQGRAVIAKAADALLEVGARLYYGLVEKLYFAAKIVTETFLDPHYNMAASQRPRVTGSRRWETNKIFAVCNRQLLADFVSAARSADVEKMRHFGDIVAGRLMLHYDERVVALAEQLRAGIDCAFDWSPTAMPDPTKRGRTLKFPHPATSVFAPLFSVIEMGLHEAGQKAEIISDRDRQFGTIIDTVLEMSRSADSFEDGITGYGVMGPFKHIVSRVEVESHENAGVQLADLCAGLVRYVARRASENQPADDLTQAWMGLQRTMVQSYWETSEELLRPLRLGPFGAYAPPFDPD